MGHRWVLHQVSTCLTCKFQKSEKFLAIKNTLAQSTPMSVMTQSGYTILTSVMKLFWQPTKNQISQSVCPWQTFSSQSNIYKRSGTFLPSGALSLTTNIHGWKGFPRITTLVYLVHLSIVSKFFIIAGVVFTTVHFLRNLQVGPKLSLESLSSHVHCNTLAYRDYFKL